MKLGIALQYYDSRNDVRLLVQELARRFEVVLLAKESERVFLQNSQLEVRYLSTPRQWGPRILKELFFLLGPVPRSRNNYYINEYFKLDWLGMARRGYTRCMLALGRLLPKPFSFDLYCRWLARYCSVEMSDLDAVLFITEICDPGSVGKAFQLGKRTAAYVYSWDHAPKHQRMSCRMGNYFTWNEQIGHDLAQLQGVPFERIVPTGATQLIWLADYLKDESARKRQVAYEYVYFGCATGQADFVRQETRVIAWVAEILGKNDPGIVLLVRPYPFLRDWSLYDPLRKLPNVRLEEGYQEAHSRAVPPGKIAEKYNRLEHARAFVHLGTTLGLECAYFDTPIIFLAPSDFDYGVPTNHHMNLSRFVRQYHSEKYLHLPAHPNVIQKKAELPAVLDTALREPQSLRAYNESVRRATPLRTMPEIVDVMERCLREPTSHDPSP